MHNKQIRKTPRNDHNICVFQILFKTPMKIKSTPIKLHFIFDNEQYYKLVLGSFSHEWVANQEDQLKLYKA